MDIHMSITFENLSKQESLVIQPFSENPNTISIARGYDSSSTEHITDIRRDDLGQFLQSFALRQSLQQGGAPSELDIAFFDDYGDYIGMSHLISQVDSNEKHLLLPNVEKVQQNPNNAIFSGVNTIISRPNFIQINQKIDLDQLKNVFDEPDIEFRTVPHREGFSQSDINRENNNVIRTLKEMGETVAVLADKSILSLDKRGNHEITLADSLKSSVTGYIPSDQWRIVPRGQGGSTVTNGRMNNALEKANFITGQFLNPVQNDYIINHYSETARQTFDLNDVGRLSDVNLLIAAKGIREAMITSRGMDFKALDQLNEGLDVFSDIVDYDNPKAYAQSFESILVGAGAPYSKQTTLFAENFSRRMTDLIEGMGDVNDEQFDQTIKAAYEELIGSVDTLKRVIDTPVNEIKPSVR